MLLINPLLLSSLMLPGTWHVRAVKRLPDEFILIVLFVCFLILVRSASAPGAPYAHGSEAIPWGCLSHSFVGGRVAQGLGDKTGETLSSSSPDGWPQYHDQGSCCYR